MKVKLFARYMDTWEKRPWIAGISVNEGTGNYPILAITVPPFAFYLRPNKKHRVCFGEGIRPEFRGVV